VMSSSRGWVGSIVLVAIVLLLGGSLAAWKYTSLRKEAASSANQPEPIESVTAAVATKRDYNPTTTSVGTVLALRSITLRNELAGTVHQARLVPGQVVEAGALLVALDVSVEQAELEAEQAQAALAQTTLNRVQTLGQDRAVSQQEIDQALAQRDVALAQIARTRAIIARKTIRAPFRARMGISDVHEGQYLKEGDLLTTLQGVDEALHVDFTVAQVVAAGLKVGDSVAIVAAGDGVGDAPIPARIVAIDARVDPAETTPHEEHLLERLTMLENTLARLAERLGLAQTGLADRILRVVTRVGLPARCPTLDPEQIRLLMSTDKKKAQGRLKFALPKQVGEVVWGLDVADALLRQVLKEACAP